MFKKYTGLVSKTIFDSKMNQMLKRIQVSIGNVTGH